MYISVLDRRRLSKVILKIIGKSAFEEQVLNMCKTHHYFLRGFLYRDVGPFVVCPLSEVLLYKHYTMYMWQLQVENEHYSYYIFYNFY